MTPDAFETTSVGAALLRMRANGTMCDGPRSEHVASGDAIAAEVNETRCLQCRRRIVFNDEIRRWTEKR